MMNENGKNQRIIIKEFGKGISLSSPVWSPDGKKILFLKVNNLQKKWSLWIMDAKGREQIEVAKENFIISSPTWLPTGNELSVSSKYNGYWQIWIMNINEKKWKRLTDTPINKIGMQYSLDGKKICFISQEDGKGDILEKIGMPLKYRKFDIYVIDADGKNLKKLTSNPSNDEEPCWSPDGEKIVYSSFCDGNYEIFVIDKDGNNLKRLTYNSVNDFVPTWSPDGKKIAFVSDGMLYLMDPDGKNQVKLTDKTQCYAADVIWSPDSKKIAFIDVGNASNNYNTDIYIIDISGKNLKNVTNTPDWYESGLSWRPMVK
ncbi:MAG: hypothetical protein AB1422_07335 [bacterium]